MSGVSFEKKCSYLKIQKATCNALDQLNDYSNFRLAKSYMEQNPDACWEIIVQVLCDFNEFRLASEVCARHKVPDHIYSKYCKQNSN